MFPNKNKNISNFQPIIFVRIISAGALQADPVRGESSVRQRQGEGRHRQAGRTGADPARDE